jgi:aerobic carbon-monoxide dehydrogenase small subunit
VAQCSIDLIVNGERQTVNVHPMKRLLDVLREDLKLTGTKEGCGEGECGACSVILDDQLVNSCLVPAMQAAGSRICTIEELSKNGQTHRLQQAFIAAGAAQCGICTPGMVMAAAHLLARSPHPTLEEIREGLSGNLCRCTGYMRIFEAVQIAAESGE